MRPAWRERSEGNKAFGCSVRVGDLFQFKMAKFEGGEKQHTGRIMRVASLPDSIQRTSPYPGFVAEKQCEFHFSNGLARQRHWLARGYICFTPIPNSLTGFPSPFST